MILEKANRIDFNRRTANVLTLILKHKEIQDCQSVHELKKAVRTCITAGQPLDVKEVKAYLSTAKSKEEFNVMIDNFKGLEMVQDGLESYLSYYGVEVPKSRKAR